jgi:hypothetical protein
MEWSAVANPAIVSGHYVVGNIPTPRWLGLMVAKFEHFSVTNGFFAAMLSRDRF